jgi:phosphinothricin acetyltransferase
LSSPSADIRVEPLRPEHWPDARTIYEEGIATGHATFETAPPTWQEWNASHLEAPRLVACEGDRVVGWAALSPVSSRCVYGGVAEVSVYVSAASRGRGVGTLLLERLIRDSEDRGIWTLQAGIFPENTASVSVHRKLGFAEVGRRKHLGKLKGQWRDVLLLERRSTTVGVD